MDATTAIRLLEGAVPAIAGTWADLGCGDGTFTFALAHWLGSGARIYAVDHDPAALSRLRRRSRTPTGIIIPVEGDFSAPMDLPGLDDGLDGILFANSLHYISEPEDVLARWASRLHLDRWVPYPITPQRLATVASSAGLSDPVITASMPSAFTGTLYAAYSVRRGPRGAGTITGP
jgi:SAM-dependent methyltransferase